MRICPYCGSRNREGTMFCEECGHPIFGEGAAEATRQLQNAPDELGMKATWGTARLGNNTSIIIHIRDAEEPIILQLNRELILGRLDPTSDTKPDLDLTPFGALEKGISRMHATLQRNEDTLTIIDMGSINGTYLNGQRLTPQQPRILHDGDEIRLGKLVLHIYFQ